MKHQYFGDVNDYRKYGLLRCIAEATNIPLGVLWLLTENDGRSDGEFRRYLREPTKWRDHDPGLYDSLARLLQPDQTRHVGHATAWGLIPNATYFDHTFNDSPAERRVAISAAMDQLSHCPIVFLDPDNGIEVKSVPFGSKGSRKYVYWQELAMLFQRGHSLLVYQHYPRLPREHFQVQLAEEFCSRIGPAHVAIFATSHVGFFLSLQPQHVDHLPAITSLVHDRWNGQIRGTRVAQ